MTNGQILNSRSVVVLIYLEFGSTNRGVALEKAVQTTARIFPDNPLRLIIVDNKRECKPFESAHVLPGDNSGREFSGWDLGIQFLFDHGYIADRNVFVFANDTLGVNYSARFLEWFRPAEVRQQLERGNAIGYIDEFPAKVNLFGYVASEWIRTNYFIMTGEALSAVRKFSLSVDWTEYFSSTTLFSESAPLSENLKNFLMDWLILDSNSKGCLGEKWHSAKAWVPENYDLLRIKARMVLTEIVFSCRLKEASVGVFDVRTAPSRNFGFYFLLKQLRLLNVLRHMRLKAQLLKRSLS